MTDYEKYQLRWMLEHGYSLEKLMEELEAQRQDMHPEAPLKEVFDEWERNSGFGSEIWACEAEWAQTEKLADDADPAELEEHRLPKNHERKLSSQEALAISIQKHGKPDMLTMCLLTGLEEDNICNALKGIIYLSPEPVDENGYGAYITVGKYLSGTPEELRDRLSDAENAAEMSPYYDDNITALQRQLCGMTFNIMDTAAYSYIKRLGGVLDKNHIPHFDAEAFESFQYASDSVYYPGKKSLLIPSENGPMLIIEGQHFVIDRKESQS